MASRAPTSGVGYAFFVACLGLAGDAEAVDIPTVYDNTHQYPIGSRAAGMAGAYTALACDEAALHYNVAALACAQSSRLELAANAYVLQAIDVPEAFGRGQDLTAVTYHSIPSIVGGVRVLLDGDPDTRAGRLVFGLSVEVPHSLALNAEPANPERPNFVALKVRDDITTGDIGLGYQLNRYVALGLSLGAMLRTFEASASSLLVANQDVACGPAGSEACLEFFGGTTDTEVLAVGGRAKLGLRVTPNDHWSVGLAATTPTLDIFGRAKVFQLNTFGLQIADAAGNVGDVYGPLPTRLEGDSRLSWPLRLALGGAYRSEAFTLSLDVSLNFPTDVAQADELDSIDVDNIPPPDDAEIRESELLLKRTFQPNVNLGAEFRVADGAVIDLGVFTDLSSVSQEDVDAGSDRIHMLGGTVALGLLGKQARGWFGLSFEMGQGVSKVLAGNFDLDAAFSDGLDESGESTQTRWTLAGFVGSNYSFFDDDDDDDAPTGAQPTPASKPHPEPAAAPAPTAVDAPPARPLVPSPPVTPAPAAPTPPAPESTDRQPDPAPDAAPEPRPEPVPQPETPPGPEPDAPTPAPPGDTP
jgi:hypothetical protein